MSRHNPAAARARRDAYSLEQTRRHHRTIIGDTAATLKARARAARLAGLDSITVHLPVGDAALIASALTEWGQRAARADDRAAITDRKGATP